MSATPTPVLAARPADLRDPVRLFHGVGVEREAWDALDGPGRRRLVVRARVAALHRPAVVSHRSAGALWGLPELGRWDWRLHVTDPVLSKTHVGRGVVRHTGALAERDVAVLDTVPVTSLLRTVTDIAHVVPLPHVVMVLDHVLHSHTVALPELERAFAPRSGGRGSGVARQALEIADGAAESAGESLSRVTMRDLRVASPVLQREFVTDAGRFRVDFWWPSEGIVGEFDGRVKYDDPSALWSEKRREDALRRAPEVRGFARWGMREALDPALLAPVLLEAGLPLGRGWDGRAR
ncbi:hypothetical protein C1N91_15085 [Curtobacterium sp. SGAir0471]|uniref:hypothetical protein n=1 Tax=Curtobacterium sp. SGAir0471 TaxID=2070337 RepID=UPI0010CD6B0E|nr:hypothetical protein [Curtobacterium sp. SGAir0471]QCR44655.1 hypothetical protein C1N91_15085 [Curtobacterium sp. SGAir0471]